MRRALVVASVASLALVTVAACGTRPRTSSAPGVQPAASAAAADPKAFTGTVAETMHAGGYTYARLQADGREDVWIAASEFATRTGDRLTVTLEMPMTNFESTTLNRTFQMVYFVATVTRDGEVVAGSPSAEGGASSMMTSHAPAATPTTVEPIAAPAGGLSIADVFAKRDALAGKQVTVRGKVTKVNNQIMERNWVHLQDGSGSASDHTNDLTITTSADVKAGDVITVTGVLATRKDIGAGYAYDALLENATIVR
jgi:hypothetical protein